MRIFVLVALFAVGCGAATPPLTAKPFAMRGYVVVLLRRGPAWTAEQTAESAKLFEGHMANIKSMGRAGKLLVAGPFDAEPTRTDAHAGLFVFDTTSIDEVQGLLRDDPAIAAGRFVPEIYPWYGPAGLTYDGKGHEDDAAP